jgi:hypothetical protein
MGEANSMSIFFRSRRASRLSRKHCGGQALGTEAERFGALNHCADRSDLG